MMNASSLNERSTFLNEPAQHNHIDYFQSFASLREKSLSSRLPAHREDAIRRNSRLLQVESNVRRLDVPLFRVPVQTLRGSAISVNTALFCEKYHEWIERLGEETGFVQIFTIYCLPRATGNVINGES